MEHERLLDELRRANPVDESRLDDWVANEGEGFLRSRVLPNVQATAGGERQTRMRFLSAAAVAIALVLAVVVPLLVFVPLGASDNQPLATNAPSQVSAPQSEHAVSRDEALGQVVSLARDLGVYRPAPVPSAAQGDGTLIQQAVGYGILLASEGPDYRLNESISRGEFAIWLWRAFGSHLHVAEPGVMSELHNLPEEEQRAISSLVQAGILALETDGQFHAADLLTTKDRSRTLGLIADRLGL